MKRQCLDIIFYAMTGDECTPRGRLSSCLAFHAGNMIHRPEPKGITKHCDAEALRSSSCEV